MYLLVAGLFFSHPSQAIKGLSNLGNSCYFNSIVQVLATLFGTAPCEGGGKLHRALAETLHAIRSPQAARSFTPRALFDLARAAAPQFRGGQQQDAHELFLALVDALQTEKSDYASSFRLATTSFVTCHSCKTTHLKRETAFDVSVELSTDSNNSSSSGSAGGSAPPAAPVEKAVFSLAPPLHVLLADVPSLLEADMPRIVSGAKRALPEFVLTEAGTFDCRKTTSTAAAWPLLTHFTAPVSNNAFLFWKCACVSASSYRRCLSGTAQWRRQVLVREMSATTRGVEADFNLVIAACATHPHETIQAGELACTPDCEYARARVCVCVCVFCSPEFRLTLSFFCTDGHWQIDQDYFTHCAPSLAGRWTFLRAQRSRINSVRPVCCCGARRRRIAAQWTLHCRCAQRTGQVV